MLIDLQFSSKLGICARCHIEAERSSKGAILRHRATSYIPAIRVERTFLNVVDNSADFQIDAQTILARPMTGWFQPSFVSIACDTIKTTSLALQNRGPCRGLKESRCWAKRVSSTRILLMQVSIVRRLAIHSCGLATKAASEPGKGTRDRNRAFGIMDLEWIEEQPPCQSRCKGWKTDCISAYVQTHI